MWTFITGTLWWGVTAQPSSRHLSTRQLLAQPSFSLHWDGEENCTKHKTCGLRLRQFNKIPQEIIIIIMNTQNRQYTILFSSLPKDQFAASSPAVITEFVDFMELLKKDRIHREVWTPGKRGVSCRPANLRLWTEHDVHGMEHFC